MVGYFYSSELKQTIKHLQQISIPSRGGVSTYLLSVGTEYYFHTIGKCPALLMSSHRFKYGEKFEEIRVQICVSMCVLSARGRCMTIRVFQ